MSRKIVFSGASDMPSAAVSLGDMGFNQTGSWRYLQPVYSEKLAPCRRGCPAGTDIPRVLSLIAQERFLEAYHLIKKTNPLPAISGRVCYHPCEAHCSRAPLDDRVSVQALERFVSDACLELVTVSVPGESQPGEVAIVGSGPAGLSCAYFLAREGFRVTIFEAESKPGGMLRIGIPAYRLPRAVLDREIENITQLGIRIETNCRIGKDIPFESLRTDYAAIFVASGAHQSRSIHLGETVSGLEFLKAVNDGGLPEIGRQLVVIGGGNTAVDAARVALRLGGQPVIVYRRTRQEMPATDEEIEAAEREGVKFMYLASPTAVRRIQTRLEVQLQSMQLGTPDASGRRRPLPVPGSTFTLEADTVIEAIGEKADLSFLTCSGDDSKIVIGGDARTGPATVVNAIAAGRQAATSIMQYLQNSGEALTVTPVELSDLVVPAAVNLSYFSTVHRVSIPTSLPSELFQNFSEIVATLSPGQAVRESKRCVSCGVCTHCDNCWLFCPEAAISRVDGGYEIDLDYCKGCGICAQECPRGVISLLQEEL